MHKQLQEYWKKALVLLFIGLTLSVFINLKLHNLQNINLREGILFSDVFFVCAMVFILFSFAELVSNLGFFNSMVFGTKCLYRLIRKRLGPSAQVKDEYLDYINTRGKYGDVSLLLLTGLGLLGISLLPIPVG
jgi:hypothetical protein